MTRGTSNTRVAEKAVLVLATLLALTAAGCGSAEVGEVRIVHLGLRTHSVDVGFDGERRVDGLSFLGSSGYLEALAGDLRLRVVSHEGSTVLVDKDLSLPSGGASTLFLTEDKDKFTTLSATDERTPSNATSPRLRFINAGVSTAAVALKSGSTTLVSSLGRGAISPYVTVKEVKPSLQVADAITGATVIQTKAISLAQGGAYTLALYATGASASTSPPLLRLYGDSVGTAATSDPSMADGNLMFVHASPGADSLTAYVDGKATSAGALKYQQASGYAPVASGSRSVSLRVTTGAATVYKGTQLIRPAGNYTIVAYDLPSRLKALFLEDSSTTPAAGQAMVRFLHLDPATTTLDVKVSTDLANLFTGVKYLGASPFVALPAGTIALEFRASPGGKVLKILPSVTLSGGQTYTVMARPPETGTDLTLDLLVHK